MADDVNSVKARAYQSEDIEQIVDIVVRELPGLPNYRDVVPARDRIHYLMANNLTNAQFMCSVLVTSSEQVSEGLPVTAPRQCFHGKWSHKMCSCGLTRNTDPCLTRRR